MDPGGSVVSNQLTSSVDDLDLHVCRYCGKSFTRRSYLLCHVVSHRCPALECDACHRQFGRVDSLRRHRCPALVSETKSRSTEAVGRRHRCPRCEKTYSRRATLLQHIVTHHHQLVAEGIKAHPCPVCRRVYVSTLSLHNHQLVIHGGTDSSRLSRDCRLSTTSSQESRDVELSSQTESDSRHPCDVDDQTASSSAVGSDAVKSCTCQFCGRAFSSSGWLRRHLSRAHTDEHLQPAVPSCQSEARRRVCPVCGKSLSSVGNLNKHLLIHAARRETCVVCGRQFHQRSTLRQHVRDVHAPAGSFAVQCPMCGLRMRSRNSLYAHLARFHASSSEPRHSHVCGTCGRAFHQRGNLHKHERTHGDTGVYLCRDCPRQLRSAERLKRHETWHERGAQLACSDCGRCFVLATDLRRHIAFRHSHDSKTYRCCYCGVCCRHYQVCSLQHSTRLALQLTLFYYYYYY